MPIVARVLTACVAAWEERWARRKGGSAARCWSTLSLRSHPAPFLLAALLAFLPLLPAAETSAPAPLAAHALLLDITRAGDRLVAVGAQGIVVISTDEGRTWRQVIVPARALLTGVSFADDRQGWIVGHDGVILATADAGETWMRQDAGDDLETVYLDVLFLDAQHGFAVGAYGKCRVTRDGGKTWSDTTPIEDEMHFNRISRSGDDQLILAGEAGTLLHSVDRGASWEQLELPYDGSLFGLVGSADGESIVVCGLRGHILVGTPGGAWQALEAGGPALLMAGLRLADGALLLAGQGGSFVLSRDGGQSFTRWESDGFGTTVADLVATSDGHIVVVGEAGVTRLPAP